MNVSLYQAASALNAMDRWQETIAANLAASSVPGYKKQDFSFAAIQAGLHAAPANHSSGATRAVLMSGGSASTNFSPGEIRITNVKSDVAIDGKGFFEVQLANGSSAYTRDGEFHVDSQGQLVTKEGYRVLGDGGPIVLDLNNYTELSISATGEVTQGTDAKGRLRLTEFGNPNALTRLSGGYFLADNPNANAAPSTTSTVRQGALEAANTSTVMEMANLMTAMRTFEANQRMAQIHDDRIAKAIADLGHIS
jgi:flagellar basal body rod protein FlgG